MVTSVYQKFCPNCGGSIEDFRALQGLPCTSCLPGDSTGFSNLTQAEKIKSVYHLLVKGNKLKAYWNLYYSLELSEEVIRHFSGVVGHEPWSLQKLWLRRLAEGNSFSMSAPTGMGKTTTIIAYSTYLKEGVLYIVPTKPLLQQICKKIGGIVERVNCGNVGDGISLVTVNYINRNFEQIKEYRPKLIAVDDADALVKSGKTVDRLVTIMGIPDGVYEDAMRLVRLRRLLVFEEKREEVEKKIAELERRISSFNSTVAQLVVASATLRPRGIKQKALKYITGFDMGTVQIYARNIIDSYRHSLDLGIIDELGAGGLILVSRDYGKEKIKEVKAELESKGYKVSLATSGKKFLEDFSSGKVDFLIGSASYYGVAVRGIDEPKRLKYVVFYGVPKSKIRAGDAILNPFTLLRVSRLLGVNIDEEKILSLNPAEAQVIKIALLKSQRLSGKLGEVQDYITERVKEIREKFKSLPDQIIGETFALKRIGKEVYLEFPDAITYLQGSGRSSRLVNGGLTLGLSITLIDDDVLYGMLTKKLKYLVYGFSPSKLEDVDLSSVKKEIVRSREEENKQLNITTGLLIVESPTKAKTISKMFGNPARRVIGGVPVYETVAIDGSNVYILDIVATRGHLTDLTTEDLGYYGVNMKDEDFYPYYSPLYRCINCRRVISQEVDKCPYCGSALITTTLSNVNAIRKIASEVENVYIATDPDVEEEKIAYDVAVSVSPYNSNVHRVKYHEVTRNGIINALRDIGSLDLNLVNGQIVRRIEDRWIGFELSKILKLKFSSRNY
ncbi:reverse gyrase, partial [Acidianus sp. RZ1]|uniref:reverse gyrase n=1 Tax=Acidianus sp. RZ1 TaxID=1540082 RepID=UPI00149209F8